MRLVSYLLLTPHPSSPCHVCRVPCFVPGSLHNTIYSVVLFDHCHLSYTVASGSWCSTQAHKAAPSHFKGPQCATVHNT